MFNAPVLIGRVKRIFSRQLFVCSFKNTVKCSGHLRGWWSCV
uniref:Uncharacterized protein n=1 Tax=Anopheles atroparvus TaxID=41427 RepID=A0AAG5DTF0_ANOAO